MNSENAAVDTWYQQKQTLTLLYRHSLRSVPFNMIVASLLAIDLWYRSMPESMILIWYFLIVFISLIRLLNSKIKLKTDILPTTIKKDTYIFCALTFLMGLAWGSSYFIFIVNINKLQEFIILLVLGGMCAGALASLSIYLPAYYAYILPMFVPIIVYNFYSWEIDRTVMAALFCLFILMLMITARLNNNLMLQNFKLEKEKDWLIKKLSETNVNLEESNDKLLLSIEEVRLMSITDALTGLYNRRHFNTVLHHELDRAKRNGHKLNLVLMDIDNFKYINDTFGHPYGDEFLIAIASCLKTSLRRSDDILFRLGGDEFAAILTHLTAEEALHVCSQIQKQFKEDIKNENVSLSMGILCVEPTCHASVKQIIARADEALYEAKRKGKKQISIIVLDK